jgi:hypothetical protein
MILNESMEQKRMYPLFSNGIKGESFRMDVLPRRVDRGSSRTPLPAYHPAFCPMADYYPGLSSP